jgi:aminoglycoside phosphotransferase (APT) family kinase protein
MDWAAAQQADQDLKNTWAEVITRFTDANYRHANLMHNDPHPGNYRFHPDGTVGVVDFGCVKVLPEPMRQAALGVMRATIDGRAEDLREAMVRAGFITADSPLTAQEALWYWSQVFYEMAVAPQPVTYAADSSARYRSREASSTEWQRPPTHRGHQVICSPHQAGRSPPPAQR